MIWIFGDSSCLPSGLLDASKGWPTLLSQLTNQEHKNFAQEAADNLYIYHTIISNLTNINKSDTVIVGWSHPQRKSFVYDSKHSEIINENTILYQSCPPFFRSKNQQKGSWSFKKPTKTNNKFFDTWFENYYSDYETRLNFLAYRNSVEKLLNCKYIPFYFSQDSVDFNNENVLYYLDFVIENKVTISEINMHANEKGHKLMADFFYDCYNS